MKHIVIENPSFMIKVSKPCKVIRVSQGYHYYCDGFRVFVKISFYPYSYYYEVKVKLPKHKTLHLIWDAANFSFHDDWLVFCVPCDTWPCVIEHIRSVFDYIWFT